MMHQRRIQGVSRRRLLTALPVAGGAVAAALVARNIIRQSGGRRPGAVDGKPRHLTLAASGLTHDPAILAARDQGIFEQYNLDISFGPPVNSGREAIGCVERGTADGAVAPALNWLPRLQQGLDARLVCGLRAGTSRLLLARGASLHRIEDLYRKSIGIVDSGSADQLFFSIVMRRKGMNPNRDVIWQDIPQDALGLALAEGHIEAIAAHDPWAWQLRHWLHLGELATSQSGSYASRVSRVLGLRTSLLLQDPQAATALVLAFQEAAHWAASHPKQISLLLAASEPAITLEEAEQMLRAEGADVHPAGAELRDQIAQYMDELKLIGMTPESLDSSKFARQVTATVL